MAVDVDWPGRLEEIDAIDVERLCGLDALDLAG